MHGFLFALQNLTRFYVMPLNFDEKKFGRGTAYFPLVGVVLGLFLWGSAWLLEWFFPQSIRAALLVAIFLMSTGAMHLDGFMDSADGILSGRPRERMLEIMKDSRVGAFGVIALVALILVKYTLFLELLRFDEWYWFILMPVASRWSMVYAIRFFPYAREEGLGKLYKTYTGNKEFTIATLTFAAVFIGLLQIKGLVLMAFIFGLTHLKSAKIARDLGGLTGDTYGAINELIEVAVLLLYYVAIFWR